MPSHAVTRKRTHVRLAPDQRRAAILESARGVFSSLGYANGNVADICVGAKIARGTFYLYFDSKADVLVAVLKDIEDRVARLLATRTPLEQSIAGITRPDGESVLAFCEARLGEVLGAIVSDENSLRVVMREARAAGGAIAEGIDRIDDMLLTALERDLKLAQQAGLLRSGDCKIMACYILGGIEKIMIMALNTEGPIDLAAIIRESVKLELFGLLTDAVRSWR